LRREGEKPSVFGMELGCDGSWKYEMRQIDKAMRMEQGMTTIL